MNQPPQPIQKTSPKDFFLHLLAILTLYGSAVAFTTLLFQYINYFFPDPLLEGRFVRDSITAAIRWSVASLIVIFPVYALTTRFLNRNYAKTPYLRNLRIRRWLIYFTLFAAALIIIGDFVALIFRLLGGEITARFILKVFALLFVTGSIFGYYLWDLREEKRFKIQPFVYGIIGLIVVAIVGAFFVVGSPKEARLREADIQRVNHLQSIQGQIIYYWQAEEKLPAALADLQDPISGFIVSRDPETGAAYEYVVKDRLSFELCANFNRPSAESWESPVGRYPAGKPYPAQPFPNPSPYPEGDAIENVWDHGVGRVCFERTINPKFYPPLSKTKD